MVPVHSYAANITDLMLTDDLAKACDIFKEIWTSGSDAAFMIVQDYILNDPELSRDDDLVMVMSHRNRKILTTYGKKVEEKVAELLWEKAHAVEQVIMEPQL